MMNILFSNVCNGCLLRSMGFSLIAKDGVVPILTFVERETYSGTFCDYFFCSNFQNYVSIGY